MRVSWPWLFESREVFGGRRGLQPRWSVCREQRRKPLRDGKCFTYCL